MARAKFECFSYIFISTADEREAGMREGGDRGGRRGGEEKGKREGGRGKLRREESRR